MELTFTVLVADHVHDDYLGHYTFKGLELDNLLKAQQVLQQGSTSGGGGGTNGGGSGGGSGGGTSGKTVKGLRRVKLVKREDSSMKKARGFLYVSASLELKHLNDAPDDITDHEYVKSVFIVHVGGTRCVTSSTDNNLKIHARITLTVEFIRGYIFIFLFYV
jgi:hypothetical protein